MGLRRHRAGSLKGEARRRLSLARSPGAPAMHYGLSLTFFRISPIILGILHRRLSMAVNLLGDLAVNVTAGSSAALFVISDSSSECASRKARLSHDVVHSRSAFSTADLPKSSPRVRLLSKPQVTRQLFLAPAAAAHTGRIVCVSESPER
jgi:hypothetical protein